MQDLNILFEDGAEPEPHEIQTALFLRKLGKEVKFLAPVNRTGVKTPDILMDNLKWEIKSPVSNVPEPLNMLFVQQSSNLKTYYLTSDVAREATRVTYRN